MILRNTGILLIAILENSEGIIPRNNEILLIAVLENS
jgi:hypothetical protein